MCNICKLPSHEYNLFIVGSVTMKGGGRKVASSYGDLSIIVVNNRFRGCISRIIILGV